MATNKKNGIASVAERRSDMFWMDPQKIHIREGWNARNFQDPNNMAQVEALAASIKQNGVKTPLAGFYQDGQFVLTDGETRLRAIKLLAAEGHAIDQVPVVPEDRHSTPEQHMAMQVVRNSGKPFTPVENAVLFQRLVDADWTFNQIAEATGFTSERIGQLVRLAGASSKLKGHVQAGRISATLAGKVLSQTKSNKDADAKVAKMLAAAKADNKLKATGKHLAAASDNAATGQAEPNEPDLKPVDETDIPVDKRANTRALLTELLSLLSDDAKATLPQDRLAVFEEAVGGSTARF